MVAFYAAVEAIADGRVGEVEIEYRTVDREENETVLTLSVRRETKHFHLSDPQGGNSA